MSKNSRSIGTPLKAKQKNKFNMYNLFDLRKNIIVSRETLFFTTYQRGFIMPILVSVLKAFLVGGLICTAGQALIDFTRLTPARILVFYVVLGVILTGLGIYGPLVDFAGAGATVPLTGFGYSLANGVKEAVNEQGLIGALTGGLTATAGGICTAVTSGLIMALLFRSGDKT